VFLRFQLVPLENWASECFLTRILNLDTRWGTLLLPGVGPGKKNSATRANGWFLLRSIYQVPTHLVIAFIPKQQSKTDSLPEPQNSVSGAGGAFTKRESQLG
jgi:hypothetical protein